MAMFNDIIAFLRRLFGARSAEPAGAPVQISIGGLPAAEPVLATVSDPAACAAALAAEAPPLPSRPQELPAHPLTQDEFITAIGPAAKACAARTKVPASVTVAQAALESSWGAHAPGMNLFGIKADPSWHGPVTMQPTHEDVGGRRIEITAPFRAYSSWEGSINDHAAFLVGNPRYRPAFSCISGPDFAEAIARCGYATDPLYATKLKSLISAHNLVALDQPEHAT